MSKIAPTHVFRGNSIAYIAAIKASGRHYFAGEASMTSSCLRISHNILLRKPALGVARQGLSCYRRRRCHRPTTAGEIPIINHAGRCAVERGARLASIDGGIIGGIIRWPIEAHFACGGGSETRDLFLLRRRKSARAGSDAFGAHRESSQHRKSAEAAYMAGACGVFLVAKFRRQRYHGLALAEWRLKIGAPEIAGKLETSMKVQWRRNRSRI